MAVVQDKLSMFDEGLEKVLIFFPLSRYLACVKIVSPGDDEPRTRGGENV